MGTRRMLALVFGGYGEGSVDTPEPSPIEPSEDVERGHDVMGSDEQAGAPTQPST